MSASEIKYHSLRPKLQPLGKAIRETALLVEAMEGESCCEGVVKALATAASELADSKYTDPTKKEQVKDAKPAEKTKKK